MSKKKTENGCCCEDIAKAQLLIAETQLSMARTFELLAAGLDDDGLSAENSQKTQTLFTQTQTMKGVSGIMAGGAQIGTIYADGPNVAGGVPDVFANNNNPQWTEHWLIDDLQAFTNAGDLRIEFQATNPGGANNWAEYHAQVVADPHRPTAGIKYYKLQFNYLTPPSQAQINGLPGGTPPPADTTTFQLTMNPQVAGGDYCGRMKRVITKRDGQGNIQSAKEDWVFTDRWSLLGNAEQLRLLDDPANIPTSPKGFHQHMLNPAAHDPQQPRRARMKVNYDVGPFPPAP